jgi:hypothetical protein
MTVQIVPARRALTGRAVRRRTGRCALAAIGASLAAVSISTFGADLETGYPSAIPVLSHSAPAGRRSMPNHPIDPPDATPDRSAQRTRIVDQLYEELMRWKPPGCSSASNYASIGGAC